MGKIWITVLNQYQKGFYIFNELSSLEWDNGQETFWTKSVAFSVMIILKA